jgi:glycosyltransferase involved in cell wall biosynthesis
VRVLHVYRTYYPDSQGGLEEVIRQICLNTRRHGVESRVLSLTATRDAPVVERPEARVYRAYRSFEIASCGVSVGAFSMFRELVQWADVVHYHFPWPFSDLLHFSAPRRASTLVTYHSDIVRQRVLGALYGPLMHGFMRSVDRIVCTSPNYFATSKVLSRYAEKVEVVPIGLNEHSQPQPDLEEIKEARQRYGTHFFLFVGVLRYYKGLHILLDAVQGAPYKVLIVGSGPIEAELKRQAAKLGLTNVVFTGYVPDGVKMALYRLCRAVVFPSYLRSEAFGVTLLEGAICERPLISTEIGSGTSHVNVDQETGFVVPPGSAAALRAAMDTLHGQPELAATMGQAARRRYEALFTGEMMGDRYNEIYRDLTTHARTSRPPEATADT